MRNHDSSWSDFQRGLYDEAYDIGLAWATDPGTSPDDLQRLLELGERIEAGEFAGGETDFGPLVDGVAQATGEGVGRVPADYGDPGCRGFIDGARDGAPDDVYGV